MINLAERLYHHVLDKPMTPEKLTLAESKGMFAKKDLVDGATYIGTCRNAEEAVWHADKQRFTYVRSKWGSSYDEDITHPEDDEGYDIFVPVGVRNGEKVETKPGYVPEELRLSPCQAHDSNP